MKWNDLNLDISGGAPTSGDMLVYTRNGVLFQPYETLDDAAENAAGKDLLEVHLFDKDKEYRAIASRSPRFDKGLIETVADFPENNESEIYRETVLLENNQGTITVLNHITYDDNGMAMVDNYRLRRERM